MKQLEFGVAQIDEDGGDSVLGQGLRFADVGSQDIPAGNAITVKKLK